MFTDSFTRELRTYVNIKSGKPLNAISKRTSKADPRPFLCWDQLRFLYRVYIKVGFEVNSNIHTRKGDWILHWHTAFLTVLFFIQISKTKVYRYSYNSVHVNIGSKRGKKM